MSQPKTAEHPDDDEGFPLRQLEAILQSRLAGRVHGIRVVKEGAGVVLQGIAATYYVKQLAQHELMNATELPLLANEIQVSEQTTDPG